MKGALPTAPEVIREAIIVMAGAVLAALVVGQFPKLKTWLQDQWKP